jgi:hypothetical protein
MTHTWQPNSKLPDLISKFPQFLNKYGYEIKNRILTIYPEYNLNALYEINDFLVNQYIHFFRVEVENIQNIYNPHSSINIKEINIIKEHKYILITDVHILIFTPIVSNKSIGKLIFVGELKDIVSFKGVKVFNSGNPNDKTISNRFGVVIEWAKCEKYDKAKLNNCRFDNVIIIDNEQNKSFIELVKVRSRKLIDNFSFFQEDLNKSQTTYNLAKFSDSYVKQLIELIEYRESLIEKENNNDDSILRDLMLLYQKIIEIFSAKNNEKYLVYMEKLHSLIENTKRNKDKEEEGFSLLG